MAVAKRNRGQTQPQQVSRLQHVAVDGLPVETATGHRPPEAAFAPLDPPAAGVTISVHPVWLEIPFVQGELFFECTLFLYSVLALFLQYLNLYKTLWWLPKSYWHYSMKLHHINPYFLSCVGLLLGLRVTKCFWNTMSELVAACSEGTSLLTQRVLTVIEFGVVKLPVTTMISTSFLFSFTRILREFPMSSVIYFFFPPSLYLWLFRREILDRISRLRHALLAICSGNGTWAQVSDALSEDDHGLLDLDNIAHMCSNISSRIREEVEMLLRDVLLRLKRCFFAAFSTAFLSVALPLIFLPYKAAVGMPQKLLVVDSWELQIAVVVFCTAFTHYITYLFPLTYLDLMYRSAIHMGNWQAVPPATHPSVSPVASPPGRRAPPVSSPPLPLWSDSAPPYREGDLVQVEGGRRFRAVSLSPRIHSVAADPTNPAHSWFTYFCSHHLSLMNLLVCIQLVLIAGQFWLLLLTTEWQHIVTLVLLMFANYLLLAKLFKDRVILGRIYEPSPEDVILIEQVKAESAKKKRQLISLRFLYKNS